MSSKQKKFAVFDIDGTYMRNHMFWSVALAMAKEDKLHPEIGPLALESYNKWRNREHELAFEDFDYGTVTKLKAMLTELDPKVYDTFVKKVIPPMLNEVHPWPKKLKEKLQSEGYMILAISGSRAEEVDMFAKHHSFDDWIGQLFYRTEDGKRYTGKIRKTFKDKDKLLQAFIDKHDLTLDDSYAVGDTSGDIPLLAMVENPIAFNPNPALLKHAQKQGWDIVIERKSIGYTLKRGKDGSYVLVKTD